MRRVVVTGIGAVTPLGVGIRRTWQRLIEGHCGIEATPEFQKRFQPLPSQVAAVVPQGRKENGCWKALEWVSKDELKKTAKFTQYALAAAEEALEDAGWQPIEEEHLEATGVCLGSGIGNLEELFDMSLVYRKGIYHKVHPLFVPRILINLAAGHISMRYGFKGPNHSATTACTTGAHSIGDASRFIAYGDASIMVAGGAESCIHPLAIAGFARSRSLATAFNDTPQKASRPFDKDRDGFVIGEGAGVLVLEEFEHAKERGANIYAEVVGYGLSADAHHLTAPEPSGNGALRAMRMALRHAGVDPAEVDFINAHATSTQLGDKAENQAIEALMEGRPSSEVNVSSTKGAIGHLLGAAGAVEAIFTILAIKEVRHISILPVSLSALELGSFNPLHVNDYDCDVDYNANTRAVVVVLLGQGILPPTLNLDNPSPGFRFNYVAKAAQTRKVDVALSNSFGFGGTNASLCFRALR